MLGIPTLLDRIAQEVVRVHLFKSRLICKKKDKNFVVLPNIGNFVKNYNYEKEHFSCTRKLF